MKNARFDSVGLYRLLLKLYPARFREEYQGPMERQFRDEYRDASTTGERTRLWTTALLDVVRQAPVQLISEVRQDLRYTVRVYRKRSMRGALAIVALALAIGGSTGVFGVVNAVLIRSLPFADPENLVEISGSPVAPTNGRPAFIAWRDASPYLRSAAVYSTSEMNLGRERGALRVKVSETSANLFEVLGAKPLLGRAFSSEEDSPGRTGVGVIGYGLWQQAFGGDRGVIGAKILVNGVPIEVIGVAPQRFDYPGGTALWVPTVFDFERIPKRGAFFFHTLGRLSIPPALAGHLFEAEVARVNPAASKEEIENRPRLIPLRERLAGPVRSAIWVLGGLVVFVLLAACANVAQLLLSRASERREEFAMRAALGASRARLIQQLVTEAIALTGCSAAIGLVVAHQVCKMASLIVPATLASQEYTILDWRVLLFAVGLTTAAGIFFGVAPVLARWVTAEDALRAHTATSGRDTLRLRWALLALQCGLTLTLAAGSLAMGRSFLRLLDVDLGFTPASAVTMNVSLQGTKRDGKAARSYYAEALQRLRAVPGVEAAGAVGYLPLVSQVQMAGSLKLDSGQVMNAIVMNGASPDYFRAIGTPFVAGSDFRSGDPNPAVIVNEAFARMTGLDERIVGRRLTAPWTSNQYEIVGVVRTARFAGPSHPGGPMAYWSIEEEAPPTLTLVARVRASGEASIAMCRDAVRSVDIGVPIYDVKTLERRLSDTLARPRFYAEATFLLGLIAVVIAVAGIYGSAARSVAQRRREMGIRMAIGATNRQVRSLVLREVLIPAAAGAGAGIVGALAGGRYIRSLIANAEPITLEVCTAAAVVLLSIAFAAAWRATTHVSSIHPAEVIRVD